MSEIRIKRKQRPWKVLSPQEWLDQYSDWRKCQPGSPKRQAFELIRRMAREGKPAGKWTERI